MILKGLKAKLGNIEKENKIAFFISLLVFFVVSISAYYTDFRTLTIWSCNLWDTLLEKGNPLLFYQYTAENVYNLPHPLMGCDILVCIPWAVWNLPIWILQRFFGLAILEHPWMLFWSKCFLILMVIGCAKTIYDIGKKLMIEENHLLLCVLLFFSGFYTLNSAVCAGQNDIMIVFLILRALLALVSDRFKLFLFFAALSIAFEPYFIFSFVAIILLKEKRIHFIALYLCSGLSIFVLQKIPFWNAPMYQESLNNGPTKAIIYKLMENMLAITPYQVSTFILCLLVVYIVAYFDNEDSWKEKALYYSMAALACFFLFVRQENYRPLYFFALVHVVFLLKPKYFRINVIMETLSTAAMIVFLFINSGDFFSPKWFLLPGTDTKQVEISENLWGGVINSSHNHVLITVVVACVATIMVINHPRFNKESKGLCMKAEPYLLIGRSLVFAIPLALVILLSYLH